jgi:hypothetical protein
VAAWKDDFIGTNLAQLQIVKGWVDGAGQTHEQVYTVAGEPGDPRRLAESIDRQTCRHTPGGFERLCAVWEDPLFRPEERAFYYVRVLEKPVCRYSTLWCRERIGVDPLDHGKCQTDLAAMHASSDPAVQLRAKQGAACCADETTFPFVQPVIQERAWTSPIWYEPRP